MSVLLLKAPDDKYRRALERRAGSSPSHQSVNVHFAEVLTFEYVNTPQLVDVLTHVERYSGLLVTSPRSALAVTTAVNGLDAEHQRLVLTALQSVSVFSVGAATSRELLSLGVVCKGDAAGSADALAASLHRDGGLPATCTEKPMVFLCGNKRRDVLPDSFRSRGLPLEELIVYETCAVANVALPVECQVPQWIVFFSPSGVDVVKHLPLPWQSIRKAAIGTPNASWSCVEASMDVPITLVAPFGHRHDNCRCSPRACSRDKTAVLGSRRDGIETYARGARECDLHLRERAQVVRKTLQTARCNKQHTGHGQYSTRYIARHQCCNVVFVSRGSSVTVVSRG